MADQNERRREDMAGELTPELLAERQAEGWRAVAVEWERSIEGADRRTPQLFEVPFGQRVADDGVHLTVDETEDAAITLMLDMIVADRTLSDIALELERSGFRMRNAGRFTQVAVFEMLPRLVEVAPDVFRTTQWAELRARRPSIAV